MIPLFTAATPPARNPLLYNGYTFNQEIGGSKKDIVEVNFARVQSVFEGIQERREFTDGMEVYGTFKRMKRLVLVGLIRGSSKGALMDRIDEFAAAFDPARVARDNPDTFGFLPFDFNVPTTDTTNYPLGVKACRYYVRAEEGVEPPQNLKQGLSVPYRLILMAADPRRYLQGTEQLAGAGIADNGKASYWSWPTVTIAMTGAGSATFAIGNDTSAQTLTLDLSGLLSGDSVAVDMENQTIKVNNVASPERYVSGGWWAIEPGSNTITVANDTNASPTVTWRPAFSA